MDFPRKNGFPEREKWICRENKLISWERICGFCEKNGCTEKIMETKLSLLGPNFFDPNFNWLMHLLSFESLFNRQGFNHYLWNSGTASCHYSETKSFRLQPPPSQTLSGKTSFSEVRYCDGKKGSFPIYWHLLSEIVAIHFVLYELLDMLWCQKIVLVYINRHTLMPFGLNEKVDFECKCMLQTKYAK